MPWVKGRFRSAFQFLTGFLRSGIRFHAVLGGDHLLRARKPAEHKGRLRVRCHYGSKDTERAGVLRPLGHLRRKKLQQAAGLVTLPVIEVIQTVQTGPCGRRLSYGPLRQQAGARD